MDKSVLVKTNEFQTAITQEWLGQYPLDVQEEFMELIGSVPLIKWMIGERPRAKDLPRDEKGRIIVDITHPHILEDMDYFMPAIKFYKENDEQYTLLKPNSNPNSEYGKWFHEEVRRCREGYVRESDGEWVTGLMYWFLNYCPIMVNVESKNTPGVYNRVEGFPAFWEGIYYRFHYIDQARKAGRHAMELSRRGSGKSFTLAGLMSHNLILGENEEAKKRVTTVLTAYTKEYLSDKDGTLTKFTPMIDHCAAKTEFPRLMLKRSASDMVWRMGYKNSNGNEMGSLNSVMALSVKDDEGKIRGKRGFILFEEMGNYPNFRDVWDNVRDSVTEGNHAFALLYAVGTAGDKESDFSSIKHILYNPSAYKILALDNVYDKTGKGAKKFAYFFPSYISRAGCMDNDGNSDVVAALMEILMNRWEVKHGGEPETIMSVIAQNPITPEEAILKAQSTFFPAAAINERLRQLDQNPRAYDEVYVGTLVDTGSKVIFKATDDIPIRDRASSNQERGALEIYAMPPDNIPPNRYIAGCLTKGQMVTTDSGLKPVEEVKLCDKLLNKDGEYVKIKNLQRRKKEDELVYSIRLVDTIHRIELTGNHPVYAATPKKKYHSWNVHLREGVPAAYYEYDFAFKRADELKKGDFVKCPIPYTEEKPIPFDKWKREGKKGLILMDNPLAEFKFWWLVGVVLGDGWCGKYNVSVSFNSSEKQYISRFKDVVKSVFNRSPHLDKDKGSCCEYSFGSIQFCQFFTENFGKYAKNKHISEWVKFLPKWLKLGLVLGYLDSDGCCTENSMEFVSISKQLLVDIQDILLSVGIISGIKVLGRASASVFHGKMCLTNEKYSLAVARKGVERFSCLLGQHDIKLRKFNYRNTVNHEIKRCWISEDGKYVFYKITDIQTRKYTGIVYNFECDTHTYMCHHLPVHNCDPIENDQAQSESLYCVFVFDLFTDLPAAMYFGRKQFANDNFELTWLLLRFFNATLLYESNRKMLYAYFQSKQALWMLADCPEYLRSKGLVKYSMFGSGAKGVSVNDVINGEALQMTRDWMQSTIPMEVKDDHGETHIQNIPKLYFLVCRVLLKEWLAYGPGVNTDTVSSFNQVMLYRQHFISLYGGTPSQELYDEKDDSEDDFFEKDWQRHLQQGNYNFTNIE